MSNAVFLALSAIERAIRCTSDAQTLSYFRRHADRIAQAIRDRLVALYDDFYPVDSEIKFNEACGLQSPVVTVGRHASLRNACATMEGLIDYAEALILKIDESLKNARVEPIYGDATSHLELVKSLHPLIGASILPFLRPVSVAMNDSFGRPDAA